jgi:tRNA nucleotidyltransferase (CCA-adding enzyme)
VKRSLSLNGILASLPDTTAALLSRVLRVAQAKSVPIHLVGGPIRDLLLGRSVVDVDLVVDGDVRAIGEAVFGEAAEGEIEIEVHERFGTLQIRSSDARVDLARLRNESYAGAGALPEVSVGTLEEDLRRRDFSVNAMVCLLDADEPGKAMPIVDLLGGLADLRLRRLRVLHARSFHDDPTRAFRAARLAARLGFSLDRPSRSSLRDALRDGAFGAVSGERWRRELQQTFAEAERGVHVGHVLRLLSNWHVLTALEPGLLLGTDRLVPLRRLSRAIADPEWVAPRWRPWLAGLSIWLAPLPAALRRRTLERFSIRGEQAKRIARFGRDAERSLRTLTKARGRGAVDALLSELPEETVQALYALADVSVRRRILRWGAEDRRRRSPVGGGEIGELGLSGPDVGRALARIRSGFLDGEIANREEALALAEEIAKRVNRRRTLGTKRAHGRAKLARRSAITDTLLDGQSSS